VNTYFDLFTTALDYYLNLKIVWKSWILQQYCHYGYDVVAMQQSAPCTLWLCTDSSMAETSRIRFFWYAPGYSQLVASVNLHYITSPVPHSRLYG